ncbi:MAG TPA: adenosylcobinamide-phosphate synthase CbiB [Atribacteraceae bacterium]|nr:adenosylcobinamide-phosphate synthase CbiB [Atribacteraceae bacterium]
MPALLRLLAGFFLDQVLGDPPDRWHPVAWIGRLIDALERIFFPKVRNFKKEFVFGFIVVFLTVGGLGTGYYFLARFLRGVHPGLFWALEIYFIFHFLAFYTLSRRGREVKRSLEGGDLAAARRKLRHLVGRDTAHLSEREMVRGTLESLAENFSDGFVAPLFYIAIFGALGGLVYKTINTLDSVLGHKDYRYYFFGFASARVDDVASFIPARLSVLFVALAASVLGAFGREAIESAWRDARRHPSPNAGWPEAALAGALGVRLGGSNYYQGKREDRPFMGEPRRELTPMRIDEALWALKVASFLTMAVFAWIPIILVRL